MVVHNHNGIYAKKSVFPSKMVILLLLWFSMCTCRNQKTEYIILENGQYFDGDHFVQFKQIVIDGNKILEIDPAKEYSGKRINIRDKFLIPGLIDAHVHLSASPMKGALSCSVTANASSSLRCGVTTVVDLFTPTTKLKEYSALMDQSVEQYSSVLWSGAMVTAPGGHGTEYGIPAATISSAGEGRQAVHAIIDSGADLVKIVYQPYSNVNSLGSDMLKEVINAAHEKDKKVFVHIDKTAELKETIAAGADVIAHLPRDPLDEEAIQLMQSSATVILPTITVAKAYHSEFDSSYLNDRMLLATACTKPGSLSECVSPLPDSSLVKNYVDNFRKCAERSIAIVAGTDAGNYLVFFGYSLHYELHQYALAGMPRNQVINTATKNIQLIFPHLKTGEIRRGYFADLLVLNSNPIEDIRNTKDIAMIFHKGKIVH